jgi:N-acetylglucosaminyldiphosphoundecaprenol N-acetyl-beta-D-mannosaminyltransferase
MSRPWEAVEPVTIVGVPVAPVRMADALAWVDEAVRTRERLQIGVVNAAKIVNMGRDAELRADVLSSHVVVADGMSVVWASRLLGSPVPERVAGIDLMHGILAQGQDRGYRVYLLGATEEVLATAARRMQELYPRVAIVGRHHGYFSEAEAEAVASAIAAARPDVLFVAMTSPRKERFLARWSGSLGVPVLHGVGGSFDVLAGKVKRAPRIWQRLGLEWLYRVKQEPGRLWRRYLTTNAAFVALVAGEVARRAAGRRPAARAAVKAGPGRPEPREPGSARPRP